MSVPEACAEIFAEEFAAVDLVAGDGTICIPSHGEMFTNTAFFSRKYGLLSFAGSAWWLLGKSTLVADIHRIGFDPMRGRWRLIGPRLCLIEFLDPVVMWEYYKEKAEAVPVPLD